jgi:hypothetical protein
MDDQGHDRVTIPQGIGRPSQWYFDRSAHRRLRTSL